MRCFALFTILALASFTDATAQVLPLRPGQRVRVTAPTLGFVNQSATFQGLHGDTIVAIADSVRHYPLSSVTRLDVYRGRKSAWARGLLIGSITGGFAGVIGGLLLGDDPQQFYLSLTVEEKAGIGCAAGAVSGALVGLIVGGLIKTDKWEKVSLERLRVSVVAQRNGFGLGASIAF